ncbi:MAG: hypothetical protein ACRC1T_11740 [Clostridium chrysemydis]|uniref:hypothetical protein n=1 Tax=Clostridium chrysemydis TaxID=2665504 RepID=UPI003F4132C7
MSELFTKENIDTFKIIMTISSIIFNVLVFVCSGKFIDNISQLNDKKFIIVFKKYIAISLLSLDILALLFLVWVFTDIRMINIAGDISDNIIWIFNKGVDVYQFLLKEHTYQLQLIEIHSDTFIIIIFTTLLILICFPAVFYFVNEKYLRKNYRKKMNDIKNDNVSNLRKGLLELAIIVTVIQNFILIINGLYYIINCKISTDGVIIYLVLIIFNFMTFQLNKKLMYYVNGIENTEINEFVLSNDNRVCCKSYSDDKEYVIISSVNRKIKLSKSQIIEQIILDGSKSEYSRCFVEIKSKTIVLKLLNIIRKTELYQSLIF